MFSTKRGEKPVGLLPIRAFINQGRYPMRSRSYLAIVAIAALACSESPVGTEGFVAVGTTADEVAGGYRPPPPIETVGEASVESEYFQIYSTYFLNPPGNNGWISFSKNQPEGVVLSSPSARITFQNQTLSGKGTLTLIGATATYVVDLATGLDGANLFGTCGASCGSFGFTANKFVRGGVSAGLAKGTVYLRNPAYRGGEVDIGGQY